MTEATYRIEWQMNEEIGISSGAGAAVRGPIVT